MVRTTVVIGIAVAFALVAVSTGSVMARPLLAGGGAFGFLGGATSGGGLASSAPTSDSGGVAVVGTVQVGTHPFDLVYDSGNGYVYVANEGSNNVSVIDRTTVVATIPVGDYRHGPAYDSGHEYVYVANYVSGTVSVISGTAVVATVPVGTYPSAAVYDSGNGYLYVANGGSNNVSVISTVTPSNPSTFFGLPPWEGYGLLAGIMVLASLGVAFGIRRVRRKRGVLSSRPMTAGDAMWTC